MNESAPQLHQTPTDIENRQMLEVAGHVLEVRPDTTGKDRFYEASPDGKLARISGAQFDELAGNQIAADEAVAARAEREQELGQARDAAVSKMAKALKKGEITENSAGPDYIKATGLSHEEVMGLGFKGFAGLAEAGRERRAEQAERKARKAELAAKRAAQEERNAAAVAWRAEIDDAKAGRAAAAERIEGISYKQKLENGGELGLKRNPNLAKELRETAVAQAEAEGHDVSHEKPRYHHVHKPSAAQLSEQAKTVEALKNFYASPVQPVAYPEDTQPTNLDDWTDYEYARYAARRHEVRPEEAPLDWVEAAGLNTPAWPEDLSSPEGNGVDLGSDDGRALAAAIAALGARGGAGLPGVNKPWSELTHGQKTLILENQKAVLEQSQRVQARQPKGGVRGFFARSKERYSRMNKSERRNAVVAGIGAAALVGVLASTAALSLRGETNGDADAGVGKETTSQAGTRHNIVDGTHLTHKVGGKHKGELKIEQGTHLEKQYRGKHRLEKGGTVWGASEHDLKEAGVPVTAKNTRKLTAFTLEQMGINWAQAHDLAIGTGVPQHGPSQIQDILGDDDTK